MKKENLKEEVIELLTEIDRTHRYSMSRIYDLSNRTSGKNEAPQSCASCLIRKVRELRRWLEDQSETAISESEQPKTKTRNRKKKQQ